MGFHLRRKWGLTMFKKYPDILTIPQVAEALGIGKKAAYALVNKHIIPALHVGNKFLIPKKGLEDYIETARNNVKL